MTDGNTATISPVTEDDMSKVRQIVEQGLNSIVAMSQLSKDVSALQTQVNDLVAQVNRYRNQIDTLDDAMYRLRQERDQLKSEVNQALADKASMERAKHEAEQALDYVKQDYNNATETVNRVSRERDDWELKAMELEEKLAKAESKLLDIQSLAMDAFGLVVPKPEPVKDFSGNVIPETAAPTPTPDAGHSELPKAEPTRVYLKDWEPGATWDNVKKQYYRTESNPLPF